MNINQIILAAFVRHFPGSAPSVTFDDRSETYHVVVDGRVYTCEIGSDDCELVFECTSSDMVVVELTDELGLGD